MCERLELAAKVGESAILKEFETKDKTLSKLLFSDELIIKQSNPSLNHIYLVSLLRKYLQQTCFCLSRQYKIADVNC